MPARAWRARYGAGIDDLRKALDWALVHEGDILLGMQADPSHFRLTVASAMTDKVETLPASASLAELQVELDRGLVAIIADASGFHGLITRVDLLNHLRRSLA